MKNEPKCQIQLNSNDCQCCDEGATDLCPECTVNPGELEESYPEDHAVTKDKP